MPGETIIVLFGLFCVALSTGDGGSRGGEVVSYHYENIGDGNYNFAYESSDGQKRAEKGILQNSMTERAEKDRRFLAVTGGYEFLGTDGVVYRTDFTADERGYLPRLSIRRLDGFEMMEDDDEEDDAARRAEKSHALSDELISLIFRVGRSEMF